MADGVAGVAKLAGGALADDPHRLRATELLTGARIDVLLVAFVAAGVGIGFEETAEAAAVASMAAEDVRGSAFGLLAGLQSAGNLIASVVAGILWTAVSPTAAFTFLAAWMVLALGAFVMTSAGRSAAR